MKALSVAGVRRSFLFPGNDVARLRCLQGDLFAASGPARSTWHTAGRRDGRLAPRTSAWHGVAPGRRHGCARRALSARHPESRTSEQVESCSSTVDAAKRDAGGTRETGRAAGLKEFRADVAQRRSDSYTEPVRTAERTADAGSS
ncbi:hypothetical protein F0Q45_11045 [Mycobacterium simiae]|uniref:Uncharacterized protein n=1 Tax=Mycobacterium simiae TaxID=1784 RepID=A0A5B1BSW2_MYCSI|nr:hypothetical protein [Mycobacterium simiae]KAA1250169.1 hypothetical protein F0Q45_11045 [Mycobacterium simiae]